MWSPCHKEPTCQIWRLYLKGFKSYDQCYFFFFKVCHRLNFWYEWEALVTRNLLAKYEGPVCNGSKVMTNVIFFFKVGHRSRSLVRIFCMSMKFLSQGTYMPNMKALSEMVKKLWPMLIFSLKLVTGQGHRSKTFVWVGSPCHKEPTCQIRRLYLTGFKSYDQCFF